MTGLAVVSIASMGRAQVLDDGFDLQPYDPSPVGDRFYAVRGASVSGHLGVDGGVIGHFAYNGLLTRKVGDTATELVKNQLYIFGGASLSLADRWLLDVSIPVAAMQNGDGPVPPQAAFGDVRLGARFEALSREAWSVAPIVELWVPTGSPDNLTGDRLPRGRILAALGGKKGLGLYGLNLGFLVRQKIDTGTLEQGSAFSFGGAAGLSLFADTLALGAELDGRAVVGTSEGFFGPRTVTLVGLGSIRYRIRAFVLGVAGGPGLSAAPGVSSRVLLSFAYAPKRQPSQQTAEPAPAPEAPQAAPKEAPPAPTAPPPAWMPPPPAPPPPPPPLEPTADDPEAALQTQRARDLFLEGIAAYDAEDYEQARKRFTQAYALRPHPTVLLNLAESELAGGHKTEACRHFQQWHAEATEPDPDLLENARSGLTEACE